MVRITEDLVRKRSEHNELIISTLEEISLHQQDIERIEHLDRWCKDLKILYLQSNLIPKIESVSKLKKLEYLNLALNNVEYIEGLGGCESLNKLDLTINFVGELTTVEHLKPLYNLRELFLTGNPCTKYEGYKEYVIATLPQLQHLDGIQIEKSERIKATQKLAQLRKDIVEQQKIYAKHREKEKQQELYEENLSNKKAGTDWYTDTSETKSGVVITELGTDDEEDEVSEKTEAEKEKEYWDTKTSFTPESRVKVHRHMEEVKRKEEAKKYPSPKPDKREIRLFNNAGEPVNVNEARIDFELKEDNENVMLNVPVFKHMDTSLVDADVQPTYVTVKIKGKILQLVLPEEVKPDSSTAKRSQTNGHLLITMPKANPIIAPAKPKVEKPKQIQTENTPKNKTKGRNELLEVDPTSRKQVDLAIVSNNLTPKVPLLGAKMKSQITEKPNSDDFVDDPDVPPLM